MLQREREVGNVFRLFRNPDEEYDNYAAPTAIKVIDHDKQRWAMLTLGDVLARTGVWNPNVTIRVDEKETGSRLDYYSSHYAKASPASNFPHLRGNSGRVENPLSGCRIIGDLDTSQLHEHTIRAAVRSIERLLAISEIGVGDIISLEGIVKAVSGPNNDGAKSVFGIKLRSICANNIWYNKNSKLAGIFDTLDKELSASGVPTVNLQSEEGVRELGEFLSDVQRRREAVGHIGASAASATVDDVAEALQTAMLETVVADEPTPEITTKVNSETIKSAVYDVVSITSDMSDAQRGSIASALVGAASGFKASKSALRKVIRNKDEGKQRDIDAAYGEALKKDMASNWKQINTEAKNIAAKIGMSNEGKFQDGDKMKMESGNTTKMLKNMITIAKMGMSGTQRAIARWYLGCSIDLPTIVSLDHQGIVTPFGAYVSCFYFPI